MIICMLGSSTAFLYVCKKTRQYNKSRSSAGGVSVVVLPDISRHHMYPSSVQQMERENWKSKSQGKESSISAAMLKQSKVEMLFVASLIWFLWWFWCCLFLLLFHHFFSWKKAKAYAQVNSFSKVELFFSWRFLLILPLCFSVYQRDDRVILVIIVYHHHSLFVEFAVWNGLAIYLTTNHCLFLCVCALKRERQPRKWSRFFLLYE